MPGLFRLKLWVCHVTDSFRFLFLLLSHTLFGTLAAPYLGMGQTF